MALYELSHTFANGMSHYFAVPPFLHVFQRRLGDVVRKGGVTVASDLLVTPVHMGTHIDAPSHVATSETLTAAAADGGSLPPLIKRGVVLDCRDVVSAGAHRLGAEELARAAQASGVTIERDDVVLVATGWEKHWHSQDQYAGMNANPPGIDVDGAAWLADAGVVAIGSDTPTLEPSSTELAVHHHLLRERGVYIIENLSMSSLLEQPERQVLFMALPLRIAGATGSPIRCVAVTGEGLPEVLAFFRTNARTDMGSSETTTSGGGA